MLDALDALDWSNLADRYRAALGHARPAGPSRATSGLIEGVAVDVRPTGTWSCATSAGDREVTTGDVVHLRNARRVTEAAARRSCSVTTRVGPPFEQGKQRRCRGRASSRRTWPQRLLIGFNVFLVGVCLVTAGGIFYTFNRFGDLPRVELAHVLSPEPQQEAIDKAQNFLLVGSDSRARIAPDDPNIGAFGSEADVGGQRSDTIMVLRIDPGVRARRRSCRSLATCGCRSRAPAAKQRINTAFSRGPDVLVATLQQNFGIPIQHFVEVDFAGFKGLVDAVGGVPVYFENPARDKNTGLNIPVSGCVTLNGDQALAYAALSSLRIPLGRPVAH